MGIIDQHNRRRQGDLAFHKHWPTKNWWHRLFSTLYGIIITDAYLMYKYSVKDFEEEKDIMSILRFCDLLACQLIHSKKSVNGMNDANNQICIPTKYEVIYF